MNLTELLQTARRQNCSDIHLTAGRPITARKNGRLITLGEECLAPADQDRLVEQLLTAPALKIYRQGSDADCSYQDSSGLRCRINAYYAGQTSCVAVRLLNDQIPTPEAIGLPETVCQMVSQPRGLVLVTGPTGSGKSTTLAALIEQINKSRSAHIITIEDPVEYIFTHDRCLIHQRQVHSDVADFQTALRSALRQDPDVIMVGEMRDLETIAMAITAAETGHLVLSTLHTNSAVSTIDRIIDVFPADRQSQIRYQLASLLIGVVSQTLLPLADDSGRIAGWEVMVNSGAVANLIREDKVHQIPAVMQLATASGMQLLDQSLARLVNKGLITASAALASCQSKTAFQQYLGRG